MFSSHLSMSLSLDVFTESAPLCLSQWPNQNVLGAGAKNSKRAHVLPTLVFDYQAGCD